MPDVIRLISMDSGVYSTKELHRGGLTTWQIRREVDIGSLVALRHGWYATPTADPDVVSAVRAGGVLGCVAALRKHGLWVPPGYRRVHTRPTRHGELTPPARPVGRSALRLERSPQSIRCRSRCFLPPGA
jgi:hypothetical protein